jgi:kinetochore protein Nuf2
MQHQLKMPSSEFVFPSLKPSEIVLCMRELSIPFSEEDLQKPTPQRMQIVYEAFADILMGYTRDSFNANVRACSNEVENFVCSSSYVFKSSNYRKYTKIQSD